MGGNEAFSHVRIGAQLRDAGWTVANTHFRPVAIACPQALLVRRVALNPLRQPPASVAIDRRFAERRGIVTQQASALATAHAFMARLLG